MTWITTHWVELCAAITSVIAAASACAALTKTPADDNAVGRLYKIVDILALNIGKAKEK
tara:strand:+ start:77 stop:253 length:177 start_codon:yes stop_codon:yes gene_type:complete